MKGYIFEYYKYVRYLRESLNDLRDVLCYKEAEHSALTYGDYDRLKINVVTDFSRYRDLSLQAKTWVGNRQSILLYELSDNPPYDYFEEEIKYGFKSQKTGEVNAHLFFALTEFNFRSELHQRENFEDLLETAVDCLRKTIGIEGKNVDYMVLGSLGVFGIAVLWFSDQYTEILRYVNNIRLNNDTLFWAAHTTISKNPLAEYREDLEEKIAQIEGKAFLQITTKEPFANLGILKQMGIDIVTHTSGEYDIAIDMAAGDVYRNFESKEIFDHDKDAYQTLFLQTHITLGEEPIELQLGSTVQKRTQKNDIKRVNLEDVIKVYGEIRVLIGQTIDKTAGLIDTLDSLLCDYRYNVVSADNERWAEDFSYLFYKNLLYIEEILLMKEQCNEVFMGVLRNMMNNLKQQIFHVAESCILNYEIPKSHLRYTGQEDGIMFCYMGIIKDILCNAYRLESCNKQSEIIPLVTVDVVPIIESELYFDKTYYVDCNEEDQSFKILCLNLPHVTFYDIPVYMQYMYHEIYHYIVPRNRELRDFHVGIVLTTLHFSNLMAEYLEEILGGDRDKAGKIREIVKPLLYMYIYKIYPEIHHTIVKMRDGKINNHAIVLVAEIYKEKLWEYLSSSKGYEVWCNSLRVIWMTLNKESDKGIRWTDLTSVIGDVPQDIDGVKTFFAQEMDDSKRIWEEYNHREDFIEYLSKITDGIKEVAADIPMIRFSNMPLDEYLLYYSNCLKNNLVQPDQIDLRDDLKELIRLGMVLGNYAENGEQITSCEELFRYKYVARFFSFSDKYGKKMWDKFKTLYQEADRWLDYFKKSLTRYNVQYKLFSSQMHAIWKEIDVQERLKDYPFMENADMYFGRYREACKQYAEALKEIWNEHMSENDTMNANEAYRIANSKYEKVLFNENIKLFHMFQHQKSLRELKSVNDAHNSQKVNVVESCISPSCTFKENPYIDTNLNNQCDRDYLVYGMKDFLDKYLEIVEKLENSCRNVFVFNKSYPFWYRGQDNSKYSLLPGLMRSNVNLRGKVNYLAQYQRQLFEEFKYRADGAPEIMDRSFFNVSDYLTLMQHYSVSTTFMDWSEDIFTALYFALEKVLNHQKKELDQNAAVYVFSPHLYNEARQYMMENDAGRTSCTEAAFRAAMKTAGRFVDGIPNIASKYNENLYDAFLLGNMEYESNNSYGYSKKIELCGKEEMAYLPIAVYTSRLNPRIRAQSGIFLAYNLYAEPSLDVDGAYNYIALEMIQKYYLEKCKRKERKERFLYKIIIEKGGIQEIVNALNKMGISKERIYPELSSVGERINYRE